MADTEKESPQSGKVDPYTLFTEILNGSRPASLVYRDETVAAFMDIRPINAGHVLVVPIQPVECLSDLDEETAAHLFRVGHRISKAIRRTDIKCEGMNFFLADGEVAGQEVFHVHLHVFPRFSKDGFGIRHGANNMKFVARDELDSVAEKISGELRNI
jgi:diadenosine tetraphosphate (Ap4A) HIT family hydrolase